MVRSPGLTDEEDAVEVGTVLGVGGFEEYAPRAVEVQGMAVASLPAWTTIGRPNVGAVPSHSRLGDAHPAQQIASEAIVERGTPGDTGILECRCDRALVPSPLSRNGSSRTTSWRR